jgi:hypothetical protein
VLLSSGTAAKLGVGVGDVIMLAVGLHWTLRHALKPTPQQVRELWPPAPVTRSWRFGKGEALSPPPPYSVCDPHPLHCLAHARVDARTMYSALVAGCAHCHCCGIFA